MCLFVRSPFYNTHAAPKGIGDNESIAAVRSTYKELCSGLTPSRIYCRAVDGTAWFETGQQLALPCTVSDGLLCRNEDNKESCLDYEIRVRACCPLSALSLSLFCSPTSPLSALCPVAPMCASRVACTLVAFRSTALLRVAAMDLRAVDTVCAKAFMRHQCAYVSLDGEGIFDSKLNL